MPPIADYDETELMNELEDLEQEELNTELLRIDVNEHKLPEVPASDIKAPIAANKDSKSELSQLCNFKHLNTKVLKLFFRTFQFFPAKPMEDDEDVKNLLAWAN